MGFNVGVYNTVDSNCEISDVFINRSYYNFVVTYDLFEEESLLNRIGEFYRLDVKPLAKWIYLDTIEDESEIKEVEQEISGLLALVSGLIVKVQSEPTAIEKIDYEDLRNRQGQWKEYFYSGQLVEDLESVSQALTYYKEQGETHIFFGVG